MPSGEHGQTFNRVQVKAVGLQLARQVAAAGQQGRRGAGAGNQRGDGVPVEDAGVGGIGAVRRGHRLGCGMLAAELCGRQLR